MKEHGFKVLKGGRIAILLLFLFGPYSNLFAWNNSIADTIIIGGKKVEIHHVVVYDSLGTDTVSSPVDPPSRKKASFAIENWGVGVHFAPGINISGFQSGVEGLKVVDEFTGRTTSVSGSWSAGVTINRRFSDQWLLRTGVLFEKQSHGYQTFEVSELHDSLFRFESKGPNSIDQILLFRYDIGSETDTINLPLISSKFQISYLSVPIVLTYEFHDWGSQVHGIAEGGLVAAFTRNQSDLNVMLINRDADMLSANNDSVDLRKQLFSVLLGGGIRGYVTDSFALYSRVQVLIPLQEPTADASLLNINSFQWKLDIGFNIFFE